jgi:hypothetical protein
VGDTIREFKQKLKDLCKKMEDQFRGDPMADKYKGVEIGPNHLVTVFWPPPELMRMEQQGLQGQDEYRFQYQIAIEDPNNWQPLDPSRTFDMYNPRFGFGKPGHPVALRIVEATPKYKLANLKCREFDNERLKVPLLDTNEKGRCFGWALYKHKADRPDGSGEWRPAMISILPGEPANTKGSPRIERYQVYWLRPSLPIEILERKDILLSPKLPEMDHYVHPAHEKVLVEAAGLRNQGKSDFEIEVLLNKMLEVSEASSKDKKASVPRITVDIIKKWFKHNSD